MCEFEVTVAKEDFKFSCAHFIAYKGFRERLHGHNYRAYIKIVGSDTINDDGYVIDFGDIKKEVRALCKSVNEFFICPTKSEDMVITEAEGQICLQCEDGARFSFPKSDCAMLPIYHSSAEELAHWLWCCVVRKIGLEKMQKRGLKALEVSVAEVPQQMATFRCPVPATEQELQVIERRRMNKRPAGCLESSDAV